VVNLIITELCVFEVNGVAGSSTELHPGVTVEDVRAKTGDRSTSLKR